jgi:hypothetical protein
MALISSASEVEAALVGGNTCSATSEETEFDMGLRGREAGSLVSQALGINRVININQEYRVLFILGSLKLLRYSPDSSAKPLEEL